MQIQTSPAPPRARKWVAFSCPHAPLQSYDAIELVCEAVRDFKPHEIICLGDLHEANSASRWPSEYDWDWEHEINEASKLLHLIRVSHRDPDKVQCRFLPGNHDDNVHAIGRHQKDTRSLLRWDVPQYSKPTNKAKARQLNVEFLDRWKQVAEYEYSRGFGTYRIGSTVFAHGFEASASSDEFQSITLGWPNGLFISGHTHRPTSGFARQAMRTKTLPLPYYYLNCGCTRDLRPHYAKRSRQVMWGHGVAYGWALPINSPRMKPDSWDAFCVPGQTFDGQFQ